MANMPSGYIKMADIPDAELTPDQQITLICRALHELALVTQITLNHARYAADRYIARGGIIRAGADGEPVIPLSAAGAPWEPAEPDDQATEEPSKSVSLADALKASLADARETAPGPRALHNGQAAETDPTPDPAQDAPGR
jgi:hypothetical protein